MLYTVSTQWEAFPTSPGIKDYVPPEAKIPGIHSGYFTKPGSGFGSKSLSDHIILSQPNLTSLYQKGKKRKKYICPFSWKT